MSFVRLYHDLGDTTSTLDKVRLLDRYFRAARPEDIGWAIHILCGGKLERAITSTQLREWASEFSGISPWLVEESYHVVGDLAETTALLVASGHERDEESLKSWIVRIRSLASVEVEERRKVIFETWRASGPAACLVFNKLVTGGMRIGVARGLVIKALAKATGADESFVAHRLIGITDPDSVRLDRFVPGAEQARESLDPYPFYLAYPLEQDAAELGSPIEWSAEWKWDGIRSQVVKRHGRLAIWSRGEELITDSFPELSELADALPDGTVVDGELLAWAGDGPAPFESLQQRLNRKRVSAKVMEKYPVAILAYDVLEADGSDVRNEPFGVRRVRLESIIRAASERTGRLRLSPRIPFSTWEDLTRTRALSREQRAEGLMVKRLSSPYGVGRRRGDWWKWKVDPYTCDGVLVYAQKGHGRRADLFTDYTFAVWHEGELVPFAKAYSGLTDREIREVDSFVKSHTRDKFGPVRTVDPELVFEIAFEGIRRSTRHKSGVAVRFPRILRWRRDKPSSEADELEQLLKLAEEHAFDGS